MDITIFVAVAVTALSPACTVSDDALQRSGGSSIPRVKGDDYREVYEGGISFREFLANADRRRDAWHDNYRDGQVPDALATRAGAVGGRWNLLVVAEDWCGDSVNTIPYLARLAEAVDGLDMRVIDSQVGKSIMEDHRTPDGRPATPTVLLLDSEFREVGCFVERPIRLQTWFLENEAKLNRSELYEQKYAWYDRDRGAQTVEQVVEMIEGAAAGSPVCRVGE